jgi:DNA-binding NarL/FixJ family response regulator
LKTDDSDRNETKKSPTSGEPADATKPPLQIILVDDSEPMRERLAASLTALEGVEIIGQASDVPSGMRLLEARHPDVLIMDVELPGQSGMDLLKIAHRRKFAPVIVMFSIHDHPKLRKLCEDNGATHYFHKLTQFDNVADLCRALVAQRCEQGK